MKTLNEKRDEEIEELNKLTPLDEDPFPRASGVLLSDKIQYLAEKHNIIKPFKEKHLKPAGYELTVGDEYYLDGKFHHKSDNPRSEIIIPPFQVTVIKTKERVCIPRFLIARWDIRVNFAYKGLLWVGGPQVDPGYKGHLFCPLYNLSDKHVHLPFDEPIASMDFVKTTKLDKSDVTAKYSLKYNDPIKYNEKNNDIPKRVIIEDYDVKELRSASYTLHTKTDNRVDKFEKTIEKSEERFNTFTTITFATLAIVISALALLIRNNNGMEISSSTLDGIIVALSVFAVMLSLLQYNWKLPSIMVFFFVAILSGIFASMLMNY